MIRVNMLLICTSAVSLMIGLKEGHSQSSDLTAPAATAEANNNVRPQRFFLGSDRLDTRISEINSSSDSVNPFTPTQGATFSGIRDRLTGTTSLKVDGVLSYVLFNPEIGEGALPERSFVSALSFSSYLDIDAEFVSRSEADKGRVILGIDSQIEVAGGLFDIQYLNFGAYYQTEMQGDANIYGLRASWTPFRIAWSLGAGGTRRGRITDRFVWSAAVNTDLQYVDNPGSTNLEQSRYSWVGLEGKLHVIPFGDVEKERIYIDVGGATYHDLVSGQTADTVFVSLGAALTDDGRINMEVKHSSGEDYSTLTEKDSLTWGVSVKF